MRRIAPPATERQRLTVRVLGKLRRSARSRDHVAISRRPLLAHYEMRGAQALADQVARERDAVLWAQAPANSYGRDGALCEPFTPGCSSQGASPESPHA